MLGPTLRVDGSAGLSFCISNKFPDDVHVADLAATLVESILQKSLSSCLRRSSVTLHVCLVITLDFRLQTVLFSVNNHHTKEAINDTGNGEQGKLTVLYELFPSSLSRIIDFRPHSAQNHRKKLHINNFQQIPINTAHKSEYRYELMLLSSFREQLVFIYLLSTCNS